VVRSWPSRPEPKSWAKHRSVTAMSTSASGQASGSTRTPTVNKSLVEIAATPTLGLPTSGRGMTTSMRPPSR
jgi:hypothetical protein